MSRNFQAVQGRTSDDNNAMGKKCNALAREILQKLADVSREMIDKKILESKDPALLLQYCDRVEEIGKLTNRPECK